MSLKSKLRIENVGMFAASIFYAVAGIICFIVLFPANFPTHIAIIGIFSLITAYGLFRKRSWAIWLVAALFFIVTTFSAVTLYCVLGNDLLLAIGMTAYLILTWIFTVYTMGKKKTLES